MINDSIVREVREARNLILASHDYDIESYFNDVMKRQWNSGHPIVAPKQRKLKEGVAGNAYPISR